MLVIKRCITGEVEVDRERREVTLSMIFKWYKGDFGPPEVLLPWLVQVWRLGACDEWRFRVQALGFKMIRCMMCRIV